METKVKEIDDIVLIGQFVSSLFPKLPVSMIHDGEQIPVKILDTNKLGIVIRSTGVPQKNRVLTFTNSGSLYNFHFKVSEKSNQELEYLVPEKMVIYPSVSRRIERKTLSSEEKHSIFITSVVLPNEVLTRIAFDESWKQLITGYVSILKPLFPFVEFVSGMDSDPRVRLCKLSGKPFRSIEVGTLSMKQVFTEKRDLESFLDASDWDKIESGEVFFPIYYRNKVFLGILKLKLQTELELDQYNFIVQTLQTLVKAIHSKEEVYYHQGSLIIEDISHKGIGFLLPRKGNTQSLSPGTKILLEVKLSKGLMAFLEATIRNLREESEGNLRLGCEFVNLTPEEKIFLENFLPSK